MLKHRVENLETKERNGIEPECDSHQCQHSHCRLKRPLPLPKAKVTVLILDFTVGEMQSKTKRFLCFSIFFHDRVGRDVEQLSLKLGNNKDIPKFFKIRCIRG